MSARWRVSRWAAVAAVAAALAAVLACGCRETKESRMRRNVRRVSETLALPDVEARMRCLQDLSTDDLLTQEPIYPHLADAAKARARDLVLRALDYTDTGRPEMAVHVISGMGPDLHDDADRIGAHLHTAQDAELRHLLASALAATGNEDAMRRHLSKALVAEPIRPNRLWYATFLWWHDLGPVEARLLTRRAGGKLPATESAALAELKKELAAGSQEAADALCFSGHLDLLSAEQKTDLAGRLGKGGHARIFPPTPEAERGAEWGD